MSDLAKLFGKRSEGSYGQCTVCKRRSAESETGLCRACAYLVAYDPAMVTTRQVAHGIKLLKSSDQMLKWPWPALHALTGPLMRGHICYVVAASGVGKTTLSLDMVRRWIAEGVGVTVLPLETTAQEWRLALAAITAGMNHGDVFEQVSRLIDGDAAVAPTLKLVEDIMMEQAADPAMMKLLHVLDDQQVTVDGLDNAFTVAKASGHKVVVIDHIDHVGAERDELTGRTASGLEAIKEVNNAVLALAKYHDVAVVAMSQANMTVQGDGTNPLLRFQKLQMKHVMYNSLKVPNASQIIGVYRPLKPGLTRHEFALARDGAIEPMDVLARDRIGLNMMKLRHRGKHEQMTLEMAYVNGTIRELTMQEQAEAAVLRSGSEPLAHGSYVMRDKPSARKPS